MTSTTRLGVALGLLTLALAGCQRDQAAPITGPRAAQAGAVTPPSAPSTLSWSDGSGNFTISATIEEGVQVTRHSRNGQVYAEVRPGGAIYFDMDALVEEQLASLWTEPTAFGPITLSSMMIIPCGPEFGAYGLASAELVAAGAYYQRNRGNRKAAALLAGAIANWAAAWSDLHSCLHG